MERFAGIITFSIVVVICFVLGTGFLCIGHVLGLDTKVEYAWDMKEVPKNAINIEQTKFTITDKEAVAKKYSVEEHIYGLTENNESIHIIVSDKEYAKMQIGDEVQRIKYEIEPTLMETLNGLNLVMAALITFLVGIVIIFLFCLASM